MASAILEQLTENYDEILKDRQTRADTAAFPNNIYAMFHGYLMKGSIDDAVAVCHHKFENILGSLKEAIDVRLEPLLANPVFQ